MALDTKEVQITSKRVWPIKYSAFNSLFRQNISHNADSFQFDTVAHIGIAIILKRWSENKVLPVIFPANNKLSIYCTLKPQVVNVVLIVH